MNYLECKIIVSEPWDFESVDGENIINGSIVNNLNNICLVFKTNNTISIDNLSGEYLILFPRSKESFANLGFENGISINAGLLQVEYNKDMNTDYLKDNSKFVLIGSLYAYK